MEYISFEHNNIAADLVKQAYDTPPLAFVHSYGCQQNVNDGERIKGVLVDIGYGLCDKPEDADLILFNTCAVREHAEQRVFGNVGALKGLKEKKPGLIVLSCAAAEHNAQHLLEAAIACAVARHAQPGYLRYLVSDNAFCATLSDCAEWLIEADEKTAARLPLPKSDAVRCVPDLSSYALRRTRMLGGAGAMAAVCACLAGVETLGEAFKEEDIRTLLGKALTEEMPPDAGFSRTENLQYAVQVCSYLENACASEKWPEMGENLLARYVRAILPAMTEYEQKSAALPRRLAFAVSALIMLYSGVRPDDQGVYTLAGKDGSMPVLDRAEALRAFSRLSCDMPCEALAYAALSDCEIWGCDLREIEGLEELATEQLRDMQLLGVCEAMRRASK